jgi:hypothetical protein
MLEGGVDAAETLEGETAAQASVEGKSVSTANRGGADKREGCEGRGEEEGWECVEAGEGGDVRLAALVAALESAAAAVLPEGGEGLPTLEGAVDGEFESWAQAFVRLLRANTGEVGLGEEIIKVPSAVNLDSAGVEQEPTAARDAGMRDGAEGAATGVAQVHMPSASGLLARVPTPQFADGASQPAAAAASVARGAVDVAVGVDEPGVWEEGGMGDVARSGAMQSCRTLPHVSYASTFSFVDEAPPEAWGAARHVHGVESPESPPFSGDHRRDREARRAAVAEVEKRGSRCPARREEEWALTPTNPRLDPEKQQVVEHAAFCPALPWRVLAPADALPAELARRAAVVRGMASEGSGSFLASYSHPPPPSTPTRIHGALDAETPAAALRAQWLRELWGDGEGSAAFERMARELRELNGVYGQVLEKAAVLQAVRRQGWLGGEAEKVLQESTSEGALETLQAMDDINGLEPIGVSVARVARSAAKEQNSPDSRCVSHSLHSSISVGRGG